MFELVEVDLYAGILKLEPSYNNVYEVIKMLEKND